MADLPLSALAALMNSFRPSTGHLASFYPIQTGKFNTSYWVRLAGEEMVLRIAPPDDSVFVFYERNMMRQEPGLHRRILAETTVPVARILHFDDSRQLIDRDFMFMERLPGRPLTEMGHVAHEGVLRQVGQMLAQVHQLQADGYGYLGEHAPMLPQSGWRDAFAIMWHKMIDDIEQVGSYSAGESARMRHLFERHAAYFERPVASSLLHMDIWHQNILVNDEGRVTGLVDWDRALWGDPEIEFAVLDYCGISEPAFWAGYGQARDMSPAAQIRQRFYLLYELQKYIVIRRGRNQDPGGARRYQQQVFQFVAQYLS